MFQLSIVMLLMSLVGSLFVCSFSSVLSALLLIFSTFVVLMVMYWNIVGVVPLYLLSLFMIGGLYVLIGFVMMADIRDLDMVFFSNSMVEYLVGFCSVALSLFWGMSSFEMDWLDGWISCANVCECSYFSCTYVFLMLYMFVFLFIIYVMMKGSWGGGGSSSFSSVG